MPIGPENFGNGASFGPNKNSALLYLARSAVRYPAGEETILEEPLALEELQNGGNSGVNDRSALHIVAALLKEVDRNGRNS